MTSESIVVNFDDGPFIKLHSNSPLDSRYDTTFTLLIENERTLCRIFLDLLIHCAVLYFQSMVKVWLYVSIHRHRLQTDVQDTECYIRTEVWRLLSGVTSLHICKLHFHYYMLSLRNTLYCHNLCKMSDISHAHKCYCSDLGQRTGQKLKRSLFNNPTCHLHSLSYHIQTIYLCYWSSQQSSCYQTLAAWKPSSKLAVIKRLLISVFYHKNRNQVQTPPSA